ncbi:hypothetical protein TNCV_300121 [Trichonephila clavipes]|nr:hypothetical protein TNCV_300121 [Trichonephila clavipes]
MSPGDRPKACPLDNAGLWGVYYAIAYRDWGLLYHSIAAPVGQDPMTVKKTWNQWVQDGNTEQHVGSQQPSHEPRVKNWAYLQDNNYLHKQFNDVCNSMDSSETMAAATLDAASRTHHSHIYVWWHRGERTLAASIHHRHNGPSPGMMTLFDTENVRLLPWPASSPIENVWSMAAKQLAHHHTSVTTVNEQWHRVEAAWASVPVIAIQSQFDSMSRHKSAVITATGGARKFSVTPLTRRQVVVYVRQDR